MIRPLLFSLFFLSSTLNADLIHFSSRENLPINSNFFNSTFMGSRSIPIVGQSNSSVQIDTFSRSGLLELDWSFTDDAVTMTHTRTMRVMVDNFPDPPEYIQFDVVERIELSFAFEGNLLSESIGNVHTVPGNMWAFDSRAEDLLNYEIEGIYSVDGLNTQYTVPFSYTLSRSPESSKTFVDPSNGRVAIDVPTYRFEPSRAVLFDSTVDSIRIRSILTPFEVAVAVPEPCGWIGFLIGLTYLMKRRINVYSR